ncbi:MarR family winged helix-turn-helix transcriptional regulator [Ilyobacter polytropus]|uniref:Transcriptional regulator, MarR family n=1 Tax=Ilyobacter polytropus (strain ATCC 51220 / DSM 2926 / LMG 16218 / CuHBu1) TaxID=572544 RepID=E3H7W0_ILYPC|nr:MarR family transcriptional regulator [Ilyobacter polytropus]ADO82912.1 transcriptional regulator, MarR family [Ilyobacter polytropus DSM 2926]
MYKKEELTNLIIKFYNELSKCSIETSKELGSYDMQIKQFHYLTLIDKTPNMTSSELSEILNITKPSVTEIINKLTTLGCVYRGQSELDKRVFYIKLTEKGKKIVKLKELAAEKFAEERLDSLTDEEVNSFIKLFIKLFG